MSHQRFNRLLGAVLALLLGLLSACSSSNHEAERFAHDLEIASKGLKGGEILKMDAINVGQWDKMFVFPPYTPIQDIKAALKSELPAKIAESRISERDDVNLLIFMSGASLQMAAVVSRRAVDFSFPIPQPLSRDRARFAKPDSGARLLWAGQG
jgi:hypothetical protein